MMRFLRRALLALVLLIVALAGIVIALNLRDEDEIASDTTTFVFTPADITRGEYLARAGNCIGCHTARGGAPYAGGRAIPTPFGTVYSSNITPDAKTGIGAWTAAHFWRALHNGRSKDGRLLYPAFPYTEYTLVTREDSDAIFAFLRSIPAVEQARRPHELRFPYDTQAAVAVWRALFFEPEIFTADASQSPEWNRGAYLVRGLGHCIACHSARNVFGASSDVELSGGLLPVAGWYAPSLIAPNEASVAEWDMSDITALLRTGVSPRGSTLGPMAEVVFRGTQYLTPQDLNAMAVYLKALPQAPPKGAEHPWWSFFIRTRSAVGPADIPEALGAKIYGDHCADCHGKDGEGARGAYPPLAGNRAVTLEVPANVIRAVLSGGYPPATAGNPRPYGMPPFSHVLTDDEIAAVVSYIRRAWGNDAKLVSAYEVQQYRARR